MFVFLPGILAVIGFVARGSEVTSSGRSAALVCYCSARDFTYPKILFGKIEEETTPFQTKLVVLRKAVYQNAFLSLENRLNVDLLLSCLGSLT